jgi:DNA-binding IclR family transcriptional regulator
MSTHRTVEKALDMLLVFSPHNQEMGTLEISKKMGLHKSTVSRILHVLARKGFLKQNPGTKKFQLGPSAMTLGVTIKKSLETNLVTISKPFMEELRDTLHETVALEVFSGTNTVLAHLSEGPHRTNLAGNIGDILSVHAAAGAKAILAFSSRRTSDRILNGTLPHLTPNTITDPALLKKQFHEIRKGGIAFDNEEHDLGTNAMAVPIFDYERKPVAALVIAGPAQRILLDADSIMALRLKETALKISKQLYFKPIQPEGEQGG